MNISLFTVMLLFLKLLFWFVYCQFWTDFTPWSTFLVISLRHVLSCLLGWVKLKVNKITKRPSQLEFRKVLAKGRSSHQKIILKGTGKGQKQPPDVFYEKVAIFCNIQRNTLKKHLLWRTSANGCFWKGGTDIMLMGIWSFTMYWDVMATFY